MVRTGGDGWIDCDLGHRHWGRFGAAGLLGYARDETGQTHVLLQHRSLWTSYGGTWGLFGGARLPHEPADTAALREATEESTLRDDAVRVWGIFRDDHGRWAYHTVIGQLPRPLPVEPASGETEAAAWVAADAVGNLPLHPGLAARWPVLRSVLLPVVMIVDAANVVGARADGWWRDRVGAAARLRDELSVLAARGVAALPAAVAAPVLDRWFPEIILVVEGAARAVTGSGHLGGRRGRAGAPLGPGHDAGAGVTGRSAGAARAASPGGREGGRAGTRASVQVVAADGNGDDAIAELAGSADGIRLVVTADRELRRRCQEAGASVTGPRWLLELL